MNWNIKYKESYFSDFYFVVVNVLFNIEIIDWVYEK